MSNYEKLRGCLHISLQLMMKFNEASIEDVG